jgi:hypothetical protein
MEPIVAPPLTAPRGCGGPPGVAVDGCTAACFLLGRRKQPISDLGGGGPAGHERKRAVGDQSLEPFVMGEFVERQRLRDDHGPVRLQRGDHTRSSRGEAFRKEKQEHVHPFEEGEQFVGARDIAGDNDLIFEAHLADLGAEASFVTVERFGEVANEDG